MAELIRDPYTGQYRFADTSTSINTQTGQTAGSLTTTPVAQAPASPAPQITTPQTPTTYTTPSGAQVNQQGQLLSGPPTAQTAGPTTPTQPAAQTQGTLTMPTTGSVVDLLNMAGQDSSMAARQELAKQFGIQGYAGTAAQNTELAKKFMDAYNAQKGKAAPQSAADASTALDSYFATQPEKAQGTSQQQFMDIFGSMNPIEANLFQQMAGLLSSTNNQQSLSQLYQQEIQAQGLPALNTQLADVNRIMEGTEDDIRAEITNAGGFATESQVQALTGARNKTLLKQANYLSNLINAKNDYVDRIVSLTQADRQQVDAEITRKLGLAQIMFNITSQMQTRAQQNMQSLVKEIGLDGLATMTANDPASQARIEKMMGLSSGSLSNPQFLSLVRQNKEWSAPYVLGNSYVQKNAKTGEIRTAASTSAAGGAGLTPYQLANFAAGLRDDVRADPDVKDFVSIRDGYERIKTGSSLNSGPGDLAIIFGYMKMLDPTSVVREQEFSNAENAIGYAQKVLNMPDKFVKGTRLTPEGKQFFSSAAERLYQTKKVNYDNAVKFYSESALSYGIDPAFVVRDFASQQKNIPPGAVLVERNGQLGYINSMAEFDPATDKLQSSIPK